LNKTVEQGISDIVGCIVFPGGWGDTLPDWLKTAITLERMMGDMKALKGREPTGTDAEACAYLMTLSLTQPMDSDWTQIYLYVAGKSYRTEQNRGKKKRRLKHSEKRSSQRCSCSDASNL